MFTKCQGCGTRWGVKGRMIDDRPGGGSTYDYCGGCYETNPRDFNRKMGISNEVERGAGFVRYIGRPFITGDAGNAYGSVLAEMSDGSCLAYICMHGGSNWLCVGCAEGLVKE